MTWEAGDSYGQPPPRRLVRLTRRERERANEAAQRDAEWRRRWRGEGAKDPDGPLLFYWNERWEERRRGWNE